MRSAWSRSITIILILVMCPGAVEIMQDALHLAVNGHTQHDASIAHHDEDATDEHGCSGSFHVCICHSSPHFVVASAIPITTPVVADNLSVVYPADAPIPSQHLDRLFRPPTT